jgi:hypothetical protein
VNSSNLRMPWGRAHDLDVLREVSPPWLIDLDLGSCGNPWSGCTHGGPTDAAPFIIHLRPELAFLVRDRGGVAENRPWLDLMGRGTKVEQGSDLSGGYLRERGESDKKGGGWLFVGLISGGAFYRRAGAQFWGTWKK